MIRFLKFMFFGLAVYGLYEFGRGLLGDLAIGNGSDGGDPDQLGQPMNRPGGRMQTLTGQGVGHDEQTLDSDGSSVHHRVGRGVIAE